MHRFAYYAAVLIYFSSLLIVFNSPSSFKRWRKLKTSSQEFLFPVPWGEVRGKWWGPLDAQPILAFHGWQDNACTFDSLVLLLLHRPILCIDLPGHGLSSHYPPGINYFKYYDGVTLIRRIVKHYDWERVTLMGHSLGGAISFLYASAYPEGVDKLICLDVPGPRIFTGTEIVSNMAKSIEQFLRNENVPDEFIPEYKYEEMIDIAHAGHNGSVTRDKCKVLMERGMVPSHKEGFYRFSRDIRLRSSTLGMLTEQQIMEFTKKIRCKVLNIRAVPGLTNASVQNYFKIMDKLKESADIVVYKEVEGTHHVHLNEPWKIANHINDFLSL